MNILASIKSEKKMSFRHWRYRLLHWTFNETATCPENSDLPKFLYTHYCPLFHLTNLIAILFPLILLVKLLVALATGVASVVVLVVRAIRACPWHKLFPRIRHNENDYDNETPEETARRREAFRLEEIKKEKRKLLQYMITLDTNMSFDSVWYVCSHSYCSLSRQEAKEFYEARIDKIIAAKIKAQERKERLRQRLIFWTNFSHVFLKWFFNIGYIALAIVVMWLLWLIVPPCIGGIIALCGFLMTFEVWPFLTWAGTWLVRIGAVGGTLATIGYLVWRFQIVRKSFCIIGDSIAVAAPPVVLVGTWCLLPVRWVCSACDHTAEFIKMFYEENCPPITIVSEEDEMMAEELGE